MDDIEKLIATRQWEATRAIKEAESAKRQAVVTWEKLKLAFEQICNRHPETLACRIRGGAEIFVTNIPSGREIHFALGANRLFHNIPEMSLSGMTPWDMRSLTCFVHPDGNIGFTCAPESWSPETIAKATVVMLVRGVGHIELQAA